MLPLIWNNLFIQVTTNADVGPKQRLKAAIAKAVDKSSDCTWEKTHTGYTLQGINISHLGKRKIIFKHAKHQGDMLVLRRVHHQSSVCMLNWLSTGHNRPATLEGSPLFRKGSPWSIAKVQNPGRMDWYNKTISGRKKHVQWLSIPYSFQRPISQHYKKKGQNKLSFLWDEKTKGGLSANKLHRLSQCLC